MKYYFFKAPRKPGDQPIEEVTYEPNEFIIGQKAMKYGAVIVLDEKAWKEEQQLHG